MELANELYLHTVCTSHLQQNYRMLKTSLVNHVKFILQYRINRYKHQAGSINEVLDNNKSSTIEKLDLITGNNINTFQQTFDVEMDMENVELIENINSIKNTDVRNVLIIAGYLVANLVCLRPLYLQLLSTLDNRISRNVVELENKAHPTVEQLVQCEKFRVKNLNIKDIIKVLELNFSSCDNNRGKEFNREQLNSSLQELRDYINYTNIF